MTQKDEDGTRRYEDILEHVEWIRALSDALLDGYTSSLAEMLRKDTPVPATVRQYLAALIEGKAKLPDARGKKNTSLTPRDRESIEAGLFRLYWHTETVLVFVHELADEQGEEVIELQRRMESLRRQGVEQIASKFEISAHTVKKYHDAGETIAHARWTAGDDSPAFFESPIPAGVRRDQALDAARAYLQYPHLFLTPFIEPAE